MTLLPPSRLVAAAWLRAALPGVTVADRLPTASAETAEVGVVRLAVVGGSPDRDQPVRRPVVTAECWCSPDPDTGAASWGRAEALAERLVAATYDPALTHLAVDLADRGDYGPARVLTVVALAEPAQVPDPSDWSRFDVDLQLHWTGA